MEREELPHFPPSQNKSRSNLSFSISSILSSNEDSSKDLPLSDVEAASESDEESSSQIRIPLVQRPESSNMVSPASEAFSTSSSLATSMMSAEFSPWLYRPTPLPGYLPLQTGFLTSRFAGDFFSEFIINVYLVPLHSGTKLPKWCPSKKVLGTLKIAKYEFLHFQNQ